MELLDLEGQIGHNDIIVFSNRIINKFQKIEPQLFALNEVKHKIPPESLKEFESSRKKYVTIKQKHDTIVGAFCGKVPQPIGNMWDYKIQIEEL